MSTTLLFAELLIAGIQVVVWFVLLVFSVFGYEWVFNIQTQAFSDWQILISVVALSFVYVLGILFDRFADILFRKWDRAITTKIFIGNKFPKEDIHRVFAVTRFQLSQENEYLHHQFEYTRSRQRIARASALNFAIITVLALVFVATRLRGIPNYSTLLWFIALTGSLLSALAIVTWHKLITSYYHHILANIRARQDRKEVTKSPTGANK
jgi:hypothetical protein